MQPIVLDAPGQAEELKLFLKDKLAHYKIPKRVIVVDFLPRNHLGKVNCSFQLLYNHVSVLSIYKYKQVVKNTLKKTLGL